MKQSIIVALLIAIAHLSSFSQSTTGNVRTFDGENKVYVGGLDTAFPVFRVINDPLRPEPIKFTITGPSVITEGFDSNGVFIQARHSYTVEGLGGYEAVVYKDVIGEGSYEFPPMITSNRSGLVDRLDTLTPPISFMIDGASITAPAPQAPGPQGEFTISGGAGVVTYLGLEYTGNYAPDFSPRSIPAAKDSLRLAGVLDTLEPSTIGLRISGTGITSSTYTPRTESTLTILPSPGYREHWFYWNGKWWGSDLPMEATPRLALMWFDDGERNIAWVENLNMPEKRLAIIKELFTGNGMAWSNERVYAVGPNRVIIEHGLEPEKVKARLLWAIKKSRK